MSGQYDVPGKSAYIHHQICSKDNKRNRKVFNGVLVFVSMVTVGPFNLGAR